MKNKNRQDKSDPIENRLDIIIRLFLTKEFSDENNKFKIGEAVKFLSDFKLGPGDIAKLVGKKKATEISPYLYSKKKKGK